MGFPFVHNSVTYLECANGKDGRWCATSVGRRLNRRRRRKDRKDRRRRCCSTTTSTTVITNNVQRWGFCDCANANGRHEGDVVEEDGHRGDSVEGGNATNATGEISTTLP